MSREIQLVGSATGTTSADLSGLTILANDLILVFAYRNGSTIAPSLASGYTNLGNAGGNTNSERTGYLTAVGGETSTGTWTNATLVVASVWRNHGGIGATSVAGASSTIISYPALTLNVPDRASRVVALVGRRATLGALETPPTGMTNLVHVTGGAQAAMHWVPEPTGGWTAESVNLTSTTTGYRTRMVEILAPAWPDTTYYINPSTGNNANNGTSPSTPWADLSMTWGTLLPGDRALLAGGTTFNGDLIWNTVSGTAAKPIVFGAYGLGAKPRVVAWADSNGAYFEDVSYVTLQDIRFSGHATSPVNHGINFWLTATNAREGIKILRCDVDAFANFGIFVGGNSGAKYDDVLIDGCLAYANGDAGITTWSGDDTLAVRHTNVTISNCVTRDNLGISTASANSGSGIILGYVDGATISNCLAHGNGGSNNPATDEAGFGIWAYASNAVIITRCEAHSNRSASSRDGGGFDLDERVTNSVIEYCYSFDNDGPGIMLWHQNTGTWSGNVVRFNISEKDSKKHSDGALYVDHAAGVTMGSAEIHHNLFYTDGKPAFHFHNAPTTIQVRNNIFYAVGTTLLGDGTITTEPQLRNNAYWHPTTLEIRWGASTYTNLADLRFNHGQETSTGLWNGDPLGYEVDPMLNAVGNIGAINQVYALKDIASYRLSPDSDLAGDGLIFDPGTATDFFDLSVSSTVANSVGPHNIAPTPASSQTITLTGFTNTSQFGTGTFQLQIRATGLGNTSLFGSPTLEHVAAIQEITPTGIGNTSQFGTLILVQEIRPAGLGNVAQFGLFEIATDELINPTGFVNLSGIGSPALERAERIFPTSVTNTSAFGVAAFQLSLEPAGFLSGSSFGALTLNQEIRLTGVASVAEAGTLTLLQRLAPSGFAGSTGFGVLTLEQRLGLTGIASGTGIGTLTLTQSLAPAGVSSSTAFGALVLQQEIRLHGMSSVTGFGTLAIGGGFLAIGFANGQGFGTPVLQQTLAMEGLANDPVFGSLALRQNFSLDGFAETTFFGVPVFEHVLALNGLANSNGLGTLVLTQEIRPTAISSTTVFGSMLVQFTSDVVIVPQTIAATNTFGSLRLNQEVFPAGFANASLFGSPDLQLSLVLAGVQNLNEFGSLVLAQSILPTGFGTTVAFGQPVVSLGLLPQEIVLPGFTNLSQIGAPALNTGLVLAGLANVSAFGMPVLSVGLVGQLMTPPGYANQNRFGTLILKSGLVMIGIGQTNQLGAPAYTKLPVPAFVPTYGMSYIGEERIQAINLGDAPIDRAYFGNVCVWPLDSMPFNFPTQAESELLGVLNQGSIRPLTPEEQALVPVVPPHTTLAWWRADDANAFTLLNGDKVVGWTDSMYGITLGQTDPAKRPVYSPTSFGGTPGVKFESALGQFLELFNSPWPIGRNDVYMVVVADQMAPPSNTADQTLFSYGGTPFGQRKIQRRVVLGYNRSSVAFGNGFTEYPHMHRPVLYWGRHAVLTWVGDVSTSLGVDGVFAGILTLALRTEAGRTRMGADSALTIPAEFADCVIRDVLIGSSAAMGPSHWDELQKWIIQRRQINFFDDFIRIEEDLETPRDWTLESGAPGILRVVNNKMVQETNVPSDSLYLSPDVQEPDQYVQATIVAPASVTQSPIIILRVQDKDNFACGMRIESGYVMLYTAVAGNWSSVGSAVPYTLGDIFRLDARGTIFRLFKNGEPVQGPFTITSFASETRSGVRAGSAAVPFLDNYENAR